MGQIIKITDSEVTVGKEDGSLEVFPLSAVNYPYPQVGDTVKVYKNEDTVIVALEKAKQSAETQDETPERKAETNASPYSSNEKRMNKHVFVWVGTFLFGELGVDRFLRGQIGLGILKLITLGAFGIWALVDFIIALTKVYGSAFGDKEDVVFLNGQYAR